MTVVSLSRIPRLGAKTDHRRRRLGGTAATAWPVGRKLDALRRRTSYARRHLALWSDCRRAQRTSSMSPRSSPACCARRSRCMIACAACRWLVARKQFPAAALIPPLPCPPPRGAREQEARFVLIPSPPWGRARERGQTRPPTAPSHVQLHPQPMVPASRHAAISAAEQPTDSSNSSVFSPSAGACSRTPMRSPSNTAGARA